MIINQLRIILFNSPLANDCIYLEIAIGTDKIKEHEKGVSTPVITFSSPNTNRTLVTLLKEIRHIKSQININITELNAACDNRFNWSEVGSQISSMPTIDTSIEGFWAKWN